MGNEKKHQAEFTFKPGGSLKVNGAFMIKDSQGRITPAGESVKLSRCGKSKDQPFCDNSHRTE
jgi:CDGSH-type Zn-finger protein